MSETMHEGGHAHHAGGEGFHTGHDHHGHHNHHTHHTGEVGSTPQASISWSSALQGLKLSSLVQGINVTPNFLFLMLFVGFFAWLFVIYWVRHNEPLANHVLGTGAAHSATGHQDRRLMEGVRNALPMRLGNDTGFIYVPNKPDVTASFGRPNGVSAEVPYVPPDSTVPQTAPINPQAQSAPFMAHHAGAMQHSAAHHIMPYPVGPNQFVPPPGAHVMAGPGAAYMVPVQTPGGVRIKRVVAR